MGRIEKKYDVALKARVAIEAVRGDKSIAQIASEYGVHPVQVGQWKRMLLEGLPFIFSEHGRRVQKNRG